MVFSSCSCSRVRLAVLSRVYQVWTRVLIHIDNKIIGGSALENSDGVNLPVVRGGSILRVGCLSYCCLGVFIVGGGYLCLLLSLLGSCVSSVRILFFGVLCLLDFV